MNCSKKFDGCNCVSKWEWVSSEVEVKVHEEVKKKHVSTGFQLLLFPLN